MISALLLALIAGFVIGLVRVSMAAALEERGMVLDVLQSLPASWSVVRRPDA